MRFTPDHLAFPANPSIRGDGFAGIGIELSVVLTTTAAAAVWPAANRALYIPLRVSDFVIVDRGWLVNGGTATGNIDIGIFNAARVKLGSTGATLQTGTNVRQIISFTADTPLNRGFYYLGISLSSGSGTAFRYTPNNIVMASCGVREEASAHPLPATATFTSPPSAGYMPAVGVLIKGL